MNNDRLEKIKIFYSKYRRLPSYSEMLKLFNFSSTNAVFKVIKRLINEGFLRKNNNKLSPTEKFFSLPFYGLVKAGFPAMADETVDFLSLDEYLINKPQSSFFLKVSGDSLTNLGIFPNDLAIIERTKEARNNELVLALIDGQWTLKILKKINGQVFLTAANNKYPPFYPKEELQIFGIVKAIIRKF